MYRVVHGDFSGGSSASFSSHNSNSQNNAFIHRKDYTFAELLDDTPQKKKDSQQTLFDTEDDDADGEGKFVQEYVCHYRQLGAEEEPQQLELTI